MSAMNGSGKMGVRKRKIQISFRHLVFLLILIAIFLRFVSLSTAPGLHFDEARDSVEAYKIINDQSRPIFGQRNYIGNFTFYFISIFYYFLPNSAFVLRFAFVLFDAAGVFLIYFALKKCSSKKDNFPIYSLLIVLSIPFSFIFGRISWDVSLLPFFTSLGFYFMLRYIKNQDYRSLIFFFISIGIGLYSHLVFFLNFAFLVLAVVIFLLKQKQKARLWHIVLGLLFVAVLIHPYVLNSISSEGSRFTSDKIMELPSLYLTYLRVFSGVLDGKLIFLRVNGELLMNTFYFNFGLLVIALTCSIFVIKKTFVDKLLISFVLYNLLIGPIYFVFFGTFTYALRYFLSFFPIGVLLIARFFSFLGSSKFKIWRTASKILLVLFFIVNMTSICINLFYSSHTSEGGFATVDIGFPETSTHFIRFTPDVLQKIRALAVNDTVYFIGEGYFDLRSVFQALFDNEISVRQINDFNQIDTETGIFGVDLGNLTHVQDFIAEHNKTDYFETYMHYNLKGELRTVLYIWSRR